MKSLVLFGLLACTTTAFAYQNPTKEGECFFADGAKNAYSCLIRTGGGVGGHYIELEFNNKEYLIEKSTTCGSKCMPHLGTIPEDVLEAKTYFRNYKTKNITASNGKNDWTCYKQNKGKLDVCYVYNR